MAMDNPDKVKALAFLMTYEAERMVKSLDDPTMVTGTCVELALMGIGAEAEEAGVFRFLTNGQKAQQRQQKAKEPRNA